MAGATIPLPGKISMSGLIFCEAIDDQQLLCDRLAAAAFGEPLSEADYLEREKLMSKQALAQGNGVRTWCLYRSDPRFQVLASCKTIKRQLLVTNIHGAHTGNGYCIISVVTHPEHRGRGYASSLLRNVAEWLDGPGDALASMLYSNKEAFYARLGWVPIPAPAILLPTGVLIDDELHTTYGIQEHLRHLHAEDIDELCKKDVRTLAMDVHKASNFGEDSVLTILPTTDLIGWQHARAEFLGKKIYNKEPTIKGAFHSPNAWIYWHHDFRKQRLFIQRVRILDELKDERRDVLAALILCAIREAQSWKLPVVVIWGVGSELGGVFDILRSKFEGLTPMLQAQRRETISVRWRGGESNKTTISPNEHYAWN